MDNQQHTTETADAAAPHPADFEYRRSHLTAGPSYSEFFRNSPRLQVLSALEEVFLDQIYATVIAPRGRPRRALDFACGTGRILRWVERHADEATGVDVSESMLSVARANVRSARLVCADITSEPDAVVPEFDLITAFRFFPNAQQSLRESVITKLASLLSPQGVLIFNNHCRSQSLNEGLRRLGRRVRGMPPATTMGRGMSDDEVSNLIQHAGLREVTRRHCGVLPAAHGWLPIPKPAFAWAESVLSRWAGMQRYAQYHLVVCERG